MAEAATARRAGARGLGWAPVAVALVPALLALLWASGAVVPRLGDGGRGGGLTFFADSSEESATTHETRRFVNEGWTPVTLTGVGVRTEGLVLRSAAMTGGGRFPHVLAPGEEVRLDLTWEVQDCPAVRAEPVELVFEVSRWWGTSTGTVEQDPDSPSVLDDVCGPWA